MNRSPLGRTPLNRVRALLRPVSLGGVSSRPINSILLNRIGVKGRIGGEVCGLAGVYNHIEAEGQGLSKIGITSYYGDVAGCLIIHNRFESEGLGRFKINNNFLGSISGFSRIYNNFTPELQGLCVWRGYFRYATEGAGTCKWGYDHFTAEAKGLSLIYARLNLAGQSKSRIANDHPPYELYLGQDASVDLTEPYQALENLPFTTPVLEPGHSYNFLLKRRNKYGLSSQNISEWSITVDVDGSLDIAPSSPQFSVVANGLEVIVTGFYMYEKDAGHEADIWALYLTSREAFPETPLITTMTKVDGMAKFTYTENFSTPGQIKVLLRTRNGAKESNNNEIKTITLTGAVPTSPQGEIYH